jgi:hypothetical protein
MEKTEWRIEKIEYFSEYGEISRTCFYIYTMKRWLGLFYYKSYIKHTECGWGDCYKVKSTFKNVEEARTFITSKLCTCTPRNKNIYTDVETIKCN